MHRQSHRYMLATTALAVSMLLAAPLAAQEATPEGKPAGAEGPQSCVAEPREVEALVALWFAESGGPAATPMAPAAFGDDAALPDGDKVDDETAAAITEVTRNWFYCVDVVGQIARGFSYMTDNLAAQFGPDVTLPEQDTPEEVIAFLEGQLAATPVAGDDQGRLPQLAGPRKPRTLPDGRVGALWSLGGDKFFLIYSQVDGQWLIDEAIDIVEPPATPVAEATPAA